MSSILSSRGKQKLPKKTLDEYREDALYREINEEIHAEKTLAFVRKYKRPLIVAAVVLVIVTIGFQLWRHHSIKTRTALAQQYETAVANMDATALAAIGVDKSGAMADLALFNAYQINGDATILEQLVNSGTTRDFRDLALMHLAGLQGDDMTAGDFEKFMAPLDTKRSPFYYSAALLVAQKYLSVSDKESANRWLDKIMSDKNVPVNIYGAAQMLK